MEQGIGVSKGYAIGTVHIVDNQEPLHFRTDSDDPEKETARLQSAVKLAKKQVKKIAAQAEQNLDRKHAEIVESQINFLEDPAFVGEAFRSVREKNASAEKAVSDITQELYCTLSELDDEYTRERAEDIKDIGGRIVKNLMGKPEQAGFSTLSENTVLFATNLKPSDTARIDRRNVIAFVTEEGGKTSHTAILAKALGIAAVVGCSGILSKVSEGMPVLVDGGTGRVILSPDAETMRKYRALQQSCESRRERLSETCGKEIFTKDGKKILVKANIGSLDELKTALENGADGVGLFRTEFLFMNRTEMPSEDEQLEVYRKAAEQLNGKPLTIRTLDIGGDKKLPYLKQPKEENPFLGLRAIRLCLQNPLIFKAQLRAILRASAYGTIRVMFPMISSIAELNRAMRTLEECRQELLQAGTAFDRRLQVGMMVEIPSAAILADDFAGKVDFFSIGTNDLTQYTLAVDRMNETISELYDATHPAVLRLIRMTIDAAHRASIPCCMCGELASEEKTVSLLLQYGLDEFSVSPGSLAEVRAALLEKAGK